MVACLARQLSRSSLQVQDTGNAGDQLTGICRFHQLHRVSGQKGALTVFRTRVSRQGDRHPGAGWRDNGFRETSCPTVL